MPIIITGGLGTQSSGVAGFVALSVTPAAFTLDINLNNAPFLSGIAAIPAGYTITSYTGLPLEITSVSTLPLGIRLATLEHTGGIPYTVTLPSVGILDAGLVALSGPFSFAYTGVGSTPPIHVVRAVDARVLFIQFGDYVIESEALDPGNYTVDHGVVVRSVTKVNDIQYLLTTTRMLNGVTYNVTVSGVHIPTPP